MALTLVIPEISYGVVQRREPKVTTIKFDDGGYELRMRRGMNTDLRTWDVPMNAIPIAKANDVEEFFRFHGGVDWFWWTEPRSTTPRKYVCRRWSREPVSGSKTHDRMHFTLEEVVSLS